MTHSRQPQSEQDAMSIPNTRFSRFAQLSGTFGEAPASCGSSHSYSFAPRPCDQSRLLERMRRSRISPSLRLLICCLW